VMATSTWYALPLQPPDQEERLCKRRSFTVAVRSMLPIFHHVFTGLCVRPANLRSVNYRNNCDRASILEWTAQMPWYLTALGRTMRHFSIFVNAFERSLGAVGWLLWRGRSGVRHRESRKRPGVEVAWVKGRPGHAGKMPAGLDSAPGILTTTACGSS